MTLGSPGLLPVPSDGGPGRAIYSPVAGAIIFKPHHSVANEKDKKFTAPVTDRVTASPLIEVWGITAVRAQVRGEWLQVGGTFRLAPERLKDRFPLTVRAPAETAAPRRGSGNRADIVSSLR